ncbi:MAG: hypothetical protein ACLFRU_08190 [Paracoccaceae bacterium]
MPELQTIHHAVLVLFGKRFLHIDLLEEAVREAYRVTGQQDAAGPAYSDVRGYIPGRNLRTELDIFAPKAMGGTLDEDSTDEGLEVFGEAYPDLPRPSALIAVRVELTDAGENTGGGLADAVLAEIVSSLLEVSEAEFVRLPGRAGLMTAPRFQTEFSLAAGQGATDDNRRDTPGQDRATDNRTGAERIIHPFPDIDLTEERLEEEWFRLDGWEPAPDRPGSDLPAVPIEARLATWTVNASVAVFSPPVAASLCVYNLLRGEDFRLNAHAMALTGFFLTLGAAGAPLPALADLARFL